MALGRRPKAREHLLFLWNPRTIRIHTKIGAVNTHFGGALFRSTTPLRAETSAVADTYDVVFFIYCGIISHMVNRICLNEKNYRVPYSCRACVLSGQWSVL